MTVEKADPWSAVPAGMVLLLVGQLLLPLAAWLAYAGGAAYVSGSSDAHLYQLAAMVCAAVGVLTWLMGAQRLGSAPEGSAVRMLAMPLRVLAFVPPLCLVGLMLLDPLSDRVTNAIVLLALAALVAGLVMTMVAAGTFASRRRARAIGQD